MRNSTKNHLPISEENRPETDRKEVRQKDKGMK